ncbi:hypothetical protein SAMN06264365_109251 [Actinoplanes regularis]|uniref:Uncharacterized protein n=2 Tax=Actinoplanes regularis TaxID=52697 RepID=A0A239BL32_9ACTN|nr:hypothetical protein Are01nite_45220 [Actinoplanes regularis]GLW30725.1 hypothetical protein Areg01_36650 [Actinoplanes regularis]SNS07753.1 hypothetical protein SAMN06264365_109251 [Actinoplanes regularis]
MTAVEPTHIYRAAVPEIVAREPAWEPEPAIFRFPAEDDPAPGPTQVLAMAGYSAMLGLTGVGVGFHALAAVFGQAPGWYLPSLALLTLLSVGLAASAFLAVHRRFLPWLLLLAAAPPMVGALLIAVGH